MSPKASVPMIDPDKSIDDQIKAIHALPSHTLSSEEKGHLSLLLNGAYAPLRGFHGVDAYRSIIQASDQGSLAGFPIPLCIRVSEAEANQYTEGTQLVLRDAEGTPLAVLTVTSNYKADLEAEALALYGTQDPNHPSIARLLASPTHCLGGPLVGIQYVRYDDDSNLRALPQNLQEADIALCADTLLQPNQEAGLKALLRDTNHLLVFVPASPLPSGDHLPYATRRQIYRQLTDRLGISTKFCLIDLDVSYQPAKLLALVAKIASNVGCKRLISSSNTATVLLPEGMTHHLLPSPTMPLPEILMRHQRDETIEPALFHPQDLQILQSRHPSLSKQGICLFFTGLSGSGKSTVARALFGTLNEYTRKVTLLDGDVVRLNLSKGLGFSKEDRDINIRRIGFVASQITRNGGIAICAPIAPYRATRRDVRHMIEAEDSCFVEVHVATDLATCESRDPKGLYAKARAGQIKGFTGIDDPYEAPQDPEIRLDTGSLAVTESVQVIVKWLRERGYIG